jgi:hypothetical protein
LIHQSAVFLLTVIGFFLAVGYKANNLSSHFTTGHEILGLIIFLLSLVEPTLGFLADKWWTPTRVRDNFLLLLLLLLCLVVCFFFVFFFVYVIVFVVKLMNIKRRAN